MTGPVAVLGAGGFIGNRLVEMLTLTGHAEVRPITRSAAGLALAGRFALDGRVADGRDVDALTASFVGCDAVIHAIAGDPATITGTIGPIYHAAAAAGVRRLVYLSSASVHGQSPAPGTDEQSPLRTRQPLAYNTAKVKAEMLLGALIPTRPLEVVILRPGIVHGPRSQWIGNFATDLLAGKAALVEGGAGICNGVYIDNLVHAVDLAVNTAGIAGRCYLIGDDETYSWADLYKPVADAMGFDLSALEAPTVQTSDRETPVARLRKSPGGRWLHKRIPKRVRAAIKALHSAERSEGVELQAIKPVASFEIAALHRCRVKLSHERAARDLNYASVVTAEEAAKRTVEWLRFAGYPVLSHEGY